jgi:hypothetical protein
VTPDLPASFGFKPRYFNPYGVNTWLEHIPFAYDLVQSVRPELVVELGTYYGESYFAFCQAVQDAGLACECRAVDTWSGDAHSGYYEDAVFAEVDAHNFQHYSRFSRLIRARFDDTVSDFQDQSISILHIDGLHTYDAVSRDFKLWQPKVRRGGIVLFHDIVERNHGFGVWRLWEELQQDFRGFAFHHSHGLGVLRNQGACARDLLTQLLEASPAEQEKYRDYYSRCGAQLSAEARLHIRHARVQLFFSGTGEFSERQSQSVYLRLGEWQTVRFHIAESFGGHARIDPTGTPGIIEFAELTIERCGGSRQLWALDRRSADQVGVCGTAVRLPFPETLLTILSTGDDPILVLPKIDADPQGIVVRAVMRVRTQASEIAGVFAEILQQAGRGTPVTFR